MSGREIAALAVGGLSGLFCLAAGSVLLNIPKVEYGIRGGWELDTIAHGIGIYFYAKAVWLPVALWLLAGKKE